MALAGSTVRVRQDLSLTPITTGKVWRPKQPKPCSRWTNWSPEQRATWFSLELVLQEAFQVLVLTRMLIRRESEYKGATDVTYAVGPDGRAAQIRGDVAEIVTRGLPD